MNALIRSDRLATCLGAVLGIFGFLTVTVAMFAPVDRNVKEAAIATSGVISTATSIGISRSNKILKDTSQSEEESNGQP